MTSFYCGDKDYITGSDLSKIYFKDSNDNYYYQNVTYGKNIIGSNVTRCADNAIVNINTINIVLISVPSNVYAYVFTDEKSISPTYVLSGGYYSNVSMVSPTHAYDNEKVIYYYNTNDKLFIENCQCMKSGTNSKICTNGLFGNKPMELNCDKVFNTTPISAPQQPINGTTEVKKGIPWWIWLILSLIGILVLGGIVFMGVMVSGMFKSTTQSTNQEKGQAMSFS